MEEAKCLMWVKNKHMILKNHHLPSTKTMEKFNHEAFISWKDHHHHHKEEEVAFVDAAATRGTHIEGGGGYIWPPRSYACSFCKRVFKSAQALGGHMNVHRRDRALLKQVITTTNNNNNSNPFLTNSPSKNLDHSKNSSKSMIGQNNPSQPRVPKRNYVPHLTPSNISSNFPQSSRNYHVKASKFDQHVKEENFRGEVESGDGYLSSYKRCKKNGGHVALFPSFLDETIKHSNVKNDSKSMDDLDLELRLGNYSPHKVK